MYQVIARKYRPQTFDEVVGQGHVKQTLRNAISQRRIAHGYIFSGPRGTGKTTMARILAMALNCEGGPSSAPDPQSAVCREIAAGNSLDVVEIDAASNRRIDDIRELREAVKFRPVRERYKVFIIDEAHQITNDAFNALLKTLEEPPEWAVFVLCTTEPQAIPATIVSRCQSFAFRSVDQPEVLAHLRRICVSEGVAAEDEALLAVALAGDGSIRDSLSTLDQAIAACGKQLETGAVRDLLGVIPSEFTERILGAIRDEDPAAMLTIAGELFNEGRHPQHFCGELARQFRNLLVMKLAGADSPLVVAGNREREAARGWLQEFSPEDLTRFVQVLLALYQDLQNATQQRFRLELGLLKLVHAGRLHKIEAVLAGLAGAPARGETPPGGSPRTATPPRSAAPPPRAVPRSHDLPPEVRAPLRPPAVMQLAPFQAGDGPEPTLQERLLRQLGAPADSQLASAIGASRLERRDSTVTFRCEEALKTVLAQSKARVEAALRAVVGEPVDVILEVGLGGREAAAAARAAGPPAASGDPNGDLERRARSDPAFLQFQKLLEGRVAKVLDLQKGAV